MKYELWTLASDDVFLPNMKNNVAECLNL